MTHLTQGAKAVWRKHLALFPSHRSEGCVNRLLTCCWSKEDAWCEPRLPISSFPRLLNPFSVLSSIHPWYIIHTFPLHSSYIIHTSSIHSSYIIHTLVIHSSYTRDTLSIHSWLLRLPCRHLPLLTIHSFSPPAPYADYFFHFGVGHFRPFLPKTTKNGTSCFRFLNYPRSFEACCNVSQPKKRLREIWKKMKNYDTTKNQNKLKGSSHELQRHDGFREKRGIDGNGIKPDAMRGLLDSRK